MPVIMSNEDFPVDLQKGATGKLYVSPDRAIRLPAMRTPHSIGFKPEEGFLSGRYSFPCRVMTMQRCSPAIGGWGRTTPTAAGPTGSNGMRRCAAPWSGRRPGSDPPRPQRKGKGGRESEWRSSAVLLRACSRFPNIIETRFVFQVSKGLLRTMTIGGCLEKGERES
jgi:hypothetical protein